MNFFLSLQSLFLNEFRMKVNWINIIYVLFWMVVSFCSSFLFVLDGEWRNFLNADILTPLYMWVIAFFGDYLFNIFSLNKENQILNECWVKVSYILIELLFILFLFCTRTECNIRLFFVIGIFILIMGLKASSLHVVAPRQKVESI